MIQEPPPTEKLEQTFRTIHEERMQGLPILNSALQVQAVGFHPRHSHWTGILITPWFMNLIALPQDTRGLADAEPGDKRPFKFPSGTCEMEVCEELPLGRYLSHSLFSPMGAFANPQQAAATAESILKRMMTPTLKAPQEQQPEPGRRALLRGLFSAGRE